MNDQEILITGLKALTSGQIAIGILLFINIGLLIYLISLVKKKG